MKREMVLIDEEKCDGCGTCIPGCPEGALQVIDGKARLVSDLLCDGLGACVGECPQGALTVESREAEAYDERRVMVHMAEAGANTVKAHLSHLLNHGQAEYHAQALAWLKENGMEILKDGAGTPGQGGGCPGSRAVAFAREDAAAASLQGTRPSQLTHWPVQMHLLNPGSPHFRHSDFLLAADCVAFALGDFHKDYLKGKTLGIACPKLDEGQNSYAEKLKALVEQAEINTLTVMIMQVPCCRGLLAMVQQVVSGASRKVPVKAIVVGLQGEILQEGWV